MKRISVFIVIVMVAVPSIATARYVADYIPARFRTRYSPHAFSYKYPAGLIDGELEYSPYALGYYPAGLIPHWLRYSPYAFSHKHPSGLISDFGCYYWPYGYRRDIFGSTYFDPADCDPDRSVNEKTAYEEKSRVQRTGSRSSIEPQIRVSMMTENDAKQVIYKYLRSKNIADFDVDSILRVGNQTVSVNFVFRDKNLIIKYWNPDEIQALMQQPGYRRKAYEKYEQAWKNFYEEYTKAGGRVYQIRSANKDDILNRLSFCRDLNER